jgi:MerR family transcriptional regulator, light-induced transcriptional regulator
MSKVPVLQYTIKDLERLSGIKAHTLRIWEQRYNLLSPNRTDTNIRYYTGDDLRKILNIAVLNQKGVKISKIVELSETEINNRVIQFTSDFSDQELQIDGLVIAMIDLDEPRFEQILQACVLRLGFEDTMLKVIYPFFKKVGVLWQTGSINAAQEHFITHLIRQKIIVAIDALPYKIAPNFKTYLLFLPEGELHEMGLLFHSFLIKKAGHKMIYLGQTVPLKDLTEITAIQKPDYLVTALLSYTNQEDVLKVIEGINKACKNLPLWIINKMTKSEELNYPENVIFSTSSQDFKSSLE